MQPSIILIGPSGAGKSTLAPLLAARLGWQAVELDEIRWRYYRDVGYDPDYAHYVFQQAGMAALVRYWRPFDLYGLERVVREYPRRHVISMGASHTVFDEPRQFARAEQALMPFPHVLLLLPTANIDESSEILKERLARRDPHLTPEELRAITAINHEFMAHPSYHRLATAIIHTEGMTLDALCNKVYDRVA